MHFLSFMSGIHVWRKLFEKWGITFPVFEIISSKHSALIVSRSYPMITYSFVVGRDNDNSLSDITENDYYCLLVIKW